MENTDYLLSGRDIDSRTPYERGRFARSWRDRSTPTGDEINLFKSSSKGFERCMEEFSRGVDDIMRRAIEGAEVARRQNTIWLEYLTILKSMS